MAVTGSPAVLGIESSHDGTGAGPARDGVLLGQAVASSMDEHARYGGVAPGPRVAFTRSARSARSAG